MNTISGVFAIGTFGITFFLMAIAQPVLGKVQGFKPPKRLVRLPNEMLFRALAALSMAVMPFLQPNQIPTPIFVIGAGIMLGSMALMFWAQFTLGKNWIPGAGIHHNHKLVVNGPYSKVRHPLYTAIGMFWVGAVVATLNIAVLVAGVFMWLSLAIRTPFEESLMRQKFKKRWDRYEASTAMFFPRLHD